MDPLVDFNNIDRSGWHSCDRWDRNTDTFVSGQYLKH